MDTEQLSMTKKTLVGVQFLFVAFGATVLVPLLIGIDPATGKEVFLTKNGTPTFDYNADDRVKIADTNPKIRGVFGISFTYKNLQASVNLRYNLGSFAFNSALFNKVENISASNIAYNQDKRA